MQTCRADGGQRVRTAALGLSERQVWRLLRRYREDGGGGIAHRARGRPFNNRLGPGLRERALTLVRMLYRDFEPTLAAETLAEKHGLAVSRETLRHWMTEDGLWLSRQQRRQFHPPRLRRERCGELIRIDGSEDRWCEDRAEPCTLLAGRGKRAVHGWPVVILRGRGECGRRGDDAGIGRT